VPRSVFSRGTAALVGGMVAAGLLASSATAATSARSAAAAAVPAATPIQQAMSLLAGMRGVRAGPPASQPAPSVAPARGGRISGRVTDQRGHPLNGICVIALQRNGGGHTQARTGLRGLYTTVKVPPGRYVAVFTTGCGTSGNWLSQVYKNSSDLFRPTILAVKAGKTTGNIDAVLRLGGEISGTVTNAAGARLSNICVFPVATRNGGQYQLIRPGASRDGAFHVRGVPAGSYLLNFTPCNPNSAYTSVWWKNSATPARARVIRVKNRQLVSGINEVMPLGGKIRGVVTAGTPAGSRLAGVCVSAVPTAGGFNGGGFAITGRNGGYVMPGLPAGRYRVQFSPGCGNNGNYLPENYPRLVTVAAGKVVAGIDGVLPRGG
jgi:hypothetical protein